MPNELLSFIRACLYKAKILKMVGGNWFVINLIIFFYTQSTLWLLVQSTVGEITIYIADET